jgi:DNA-binding transcriptional MerR regulator
MENNKEKLKKLISIINEVIERAKKLGVDFGNTDPKNRLRYYVKIGLLPHAKRKIFKKNGKPERAYPEEIVWKLFEIDRKIKEGKTILEIKKEIEEIKSEKEEIFESKEKNTETPQTIELPKIELEEKTIELPKIEIEPLKEIEKKYFVKMPLIIFSILIFGFVSIWLLNDTDFKKTFLYFSSLSNSIAPLAQLTRELQGSSEKVSTEGMFSNFFNVEPYLTINAETAIEGSLSVSKEILSPIFRASDSMEAPNFVITKGDLKATLSTQALTADRTYTFPDQSGIVCLSTGNCFGLRGEVTSAGGTTNRLAKFSGPRTLSNSSISDLFNGIAITIDAFGNVGIGTQNPRGKLEVAGNLITTGNLGIGISSPQYPLHVSGRIQATGDICTDLGGGKCLSQLAPPSPPVITPTPIIVGRGGGVGGSGTPNYIPIWTGANTLSNSILSQIGTKLTLTGDLDISGFLTTAGLKTLTFQLATTTTPGFILTAADAEGNITFAPPPSGTIPVGTKLLRASLPIFKYSSPAQTASTSFVEITKKFSTSTLEKLLPPKIPSSQRKFALLIKFSDNIPNTASSTWRIDFDSLSDFDFEFQGQNLSSLDSGILHLKDEIQNLTNDNWVLKVKVPSNYYSLRIFNIFLLCYDEIF